MPNTTTPLPRRSSQGVVKIDKGYVKTDDTGDYRVVWGGGGSHGLHLECGFTYTGRGRKWEEIGYRTVGDQSRDLTVQEGRQEVFDWVEWINSGDPEALEFG